MPYVDGFVIAVPTANKQEFIEHAKFMDPIFKDLGALRIVECWGDDVPDGKVTDFRMAVKATEDESVVLSWMEWPDKATRDDAMKRLEDMMANDERFDPEKYPIPFDGQRMIFGGFQPIVEF